MLVALVPEGVVTVMSQVPAGADGDSATIQFGVSTRKSAGSRPKTTDVAPVKLLPSMSTSRPPAVDPDFGNTSFTTGAFPVDGATNVYVSALLSPPGVVTVTLTAPEDPGGLVTVIEVAVSAVIVPAVVPKSTAVAPERPVPEIVTEVPPATGPLVGLSAVIAGGET
jgi:hypothetical protein